MVAYKHKRTHSFKTEYNSRVFFLGFLLSHWTCWDFSLYACYVFFSIAFFVYSFAHMRVCYECEWKCPKRCIDENTCSRLCNRPAHPQWSPPKVKAESTAALCKQLATTFTFAPLTLLHTGSAALVGMNKVCKGACFCVLLCVRKYECVENFIFDEFYYVLDYVFMCLCVTCLFIYLYVMRVHAKVCVWACLCIYSTHLDTLQQLDSDYRSRPWQQHCHLRQHNGPAKHTLEPAALWLWQQRQSGAAPLLHGSQHEPRRRWWLWQAAVALLRFVTSLVQPHTLALGSQWPNKPRYILIHTPALVHSEHSRAIGFRGRVLVIFVDSRNKDTTHCTPFQRWFGGTPDHPTVT